MGRKEGLLRAISGFCLSGGWRLSAWVLGFLSSVGVGVGCLRRAFFLYACGVGLSLICFACVVLFCLCACGVGLSLICLWSISVRPCAGQALTFFAAAKKVSKESGSNREC
jgi:hypothetical protein